jgi:hypothetical protein
MNWVTDVERANKLLLQAGTCRFVDNRRIATSMQCMSFCDIATFTKEFGVLVHRLMQLSEDSVCNYVILNPDPKHFFLPHFSRYPVTELHYGDTLDQYAASFNESFGTNPADTLNTLCYEWVIIPQSHRWFVHCLRSSEQSSGHLWLPEKWVEEAHNTYEGLTYPAELEANTDTTWPA